MSLRSDLILAARHARRSPAFTVVIVLTLGLGLGAATAVFSVAEAVLLRGLPYDEPDRIVHIGESAELEPESVRELSWPDYLDLRKETHRVFERVGGYGYAGGFRIDADEGPVRIDGAMVTVDFFAVLGVDPIIGRAFRPKEEQPGSERVALISHSLWMTRFGGSRDVVGRRLWREDTPIEIIGVLPPQFHFAPSGTPDIWVALVPNEMQRERRYMHWLKPVARLATGVSIEQARQATAQLARGFHDPDPVRGDTTLSIVPLAERIVGKMDRIVEALLAAAGLVLLITIVNVANLLIARSSARASEIATRLALGGTRRHIIAQFVAEGSILGLLGAIAGIGMARPATSLLIASIPGEIRASMPYLSEVGVNVPVLLFSIMATSIAAALIGTVSAVHAARVGGASASPTGGRIVAPANRLRSALVAMEAGLSLTLVIAAGLLLRSTGALSAVDPGFDRHNLLTMRVELPSTGFEEPEQRIAFFDRAIERIEARAGVVSASLVNKLPLSGFGNTGTPTLAGYPEPSERVSANIRGISRDYFETMRIPLIAGRTFSIDDTADRPLVAVVSESLARRLLPGERIVGKSIRFVFIDSDVEIVGVVGDENVGSLDAEPEPMVYFAFRQEPGPSWFIVTRTSAEPTGLAGEVVREIRALAPRALVHSVASMDELVESSPAFFLRGYPLTLIGVFSVIALVLAGIGVFGIVAYSASLRTKEFGLRLALGADRASLFGQVVRQAAKLVVLGVAVGVAIAVPMTGLLSSLLFEIDRMDVATWSASALLLVLTALAASIGPALRATRTDPAVALRYDG